MEQQATSQSVSNPDTLDQIALSQVATTTLEGAVKVTAVDAIRRPMFSTRPMLVLTDLVVQESSMNRSSKAASSSLLKLALS